MQVGVEFADFGARQTMLERVGAIRAAAAEGFESIWVNNGLGLDGLTLLAVAGQGLQGCRIGTAVIPVYGRHPLVFAQHALTVQAALEVPLVVGLGASHPAITEGFYGIK